MGKLSKLSLSFFAVGLVIGSQPLLSKAGAIQAKKEAIVEVKTEDGTKIGFGKPTVKSQSKVSNKFSISSLLGEDTNTLETVNEVNGNTVEQTITIDSEDSNSVIEVPVSLNDGEYIVLAEDADGNSSGAGLIYNAEGGSIGVISEPVVEDGSELNVKDVDLNGNNIQLKLESEDKLSEPTFVTMAASATYYSSYFSSGKWITRDGVISLSMTHKAYLHSGTTNDRAMKLADSWHKLKTVHSTNSRWKNTNGLQDQYNCHYATIGKAKNPWNIEPSRPDVSYAQTVLKACNP